MSSTPKRHQKKKWGTILGTAGAMIVSPVLAQGQAGFDVEDVPAVDPNEPVGLFDVADGDVEGESNINMDSFGKVDLAVKDLEIAKVLQLLSIQSQKNIVTSRNVSGTVSADLYGVTFHEALDAILEPNGFGYEEKGNFIYVYTADELQERQDAARSLSTKIIRLNYLNGEDAQTIAEAMMSDAGSVTFSSEVEDGFLPSESDAGGNSFALPDSIIVRDYDENIAAVESIIAELDVRPKQVLIEATILQAQLTENNAFGVDFSVFTNLNAFDFANPLNAIGSLINGNGPDGDSGGGVQSTVGNTAGPGGVKVGYVGSDAAVFVRALDSVTDTTVVAKPNILVLNRQKADLLVGQRLGYLSTTVTDTSNTQTVEFLDVGTQLTVRPFISNEGTVRLELRPAISDGAVREQAGFVIPDETTQELITNIIVEDGQTVVIGGLFKEDTTNNRNQVPGLGDLPGIGAAFKGKDDTVERSEVIFLIKTTIMEPSQLAIGGETAEEAIRNKRLGAKQGLLPWSNDKLVSSNLLTARKALEEGNTKKALWHTNLALHISPVAADALALKQEITGEQIAYHDRSQLRGIMDSMIDADVEALAPKATGEAEVAETPANDWSAPQAQTEQTTNEPDGADAFVEIESQLEAESWGDGAADAGYEAESFQSESKPAEVVDTFTPAAEEAVAESSEPVQAEAFEAEAFEPAFVEAQPQTQAPTEVEEVPALQDEFAEGQYDWSDAAPAQTAQTAQTPEFAEPQAESFDAGEPVTEVQFVESSEAADESGAFEGETAEAQTAGETAEFQTGDSDWDAAFPQQGEQSADAAAAQEFQTDEFFNEAVTAESAADAQPFDADLFFESGQAEVPEFATELSQPVEGEPAEAVAEDTENADDDIADYYEQLMTEVQTDSDQ